MEEKGQAFLAKAANNKRWAKDTIESFLLHHKQRINYSSPTSSNNKDKKIRPRTLKNYLTPIQAFYDAHSDDDDDGNDLPRLN